MLSGQVVGEGEWSQPLWPLRDVFSVYLPAAGLEVMELEATLSSNK